MDIDSEVEDRLAELVAGSDKDLQTAKDVFEDKYEDLAKRVEGDANEDMITDHAIRMVRSEIHSSTRTTGEVQNVGIVSIGHGGTRTWTDDDTGEDFEVLISYGIINIPQDGPSDDKQGIGVFLNRETDGVDIDNLKKKFDTLNELDAYYAVSEYDRLPNTFICDATDQTKVEVVDDPAPQDARKGLIDKYSDDIELDDIKGNLSESNNGSPIGFGADIKRMEATVVDYVDLDDNDTSIYTLLDDSVVDPSDLPDDVRDDRAQTPGLTAWTPDQFLKYGTNSQIEVYGSVTRMNNGRVAMNVFGIIPVLSFEMSDSGDGSGGSVRVESEEI